MASENILEVLDSKKYTALELYKRVSNLAVKPESCISTQAWDKMVENDKQKIRKMLRTLQDDMSGVDLNKVTAESEIMNTLKETITYIASAEAYVLSSVAIQTAFENIPNSQVKAKVKEFIKSMNSAGVQEKDMITFANFLLMLSDVAFHCKHESQNGVIRKFGNALIANLTSITNNTPIKHDPFEITELMMTYNKHKLYAH